MVNYIQSKKKKKKPLIQSVGGVAYVNLNIVCGMRYAQ